MPTAVRKYNQFQFEKWVGCFPIKALVGKPEWRDDQRQRDCTVPWWQVVGPSIQSLLDQFPRKEARIKELFYANQPGIVKWAWDHRILPFLPYHFGGMGLPPRNKKEATLACVPRALRAGIIHHAFNPLGNFSWKSNVVKIDRSKVLPQAMEVLKQQLNTGLTIFIRPGKTPPPGY
jgi:hypothetical protein